jgi:excisionase family DNA binding protein
MSQLLTVHQVAEKLHYHPGSIRRLIRRGVLRGYKLQPNGHLFLRENEIDAALADGRLFAPTPDVVAMTSSIEGS